MYLVCPPLNTNYEPITTTDLNDTLFVASSHVLCAVVLQVVLYIVLILDVFVAPSPYGEAGGMVRHSSNVSFLRLRDYQSKHGAYYRKARCIR